jgi:hypothetical protein
MEHFPVTRKQSRWLNVWFAVCALAVFLLGLPIAGPLDDDSGAGTLMGQAFSNGGLWSALFWLSSLLWLGFLLVFAMTVSPVDRYLKVFSRGAVGGYVVFRVLTLVGIFYPLTTGTGSLKWLGLLYTLASYFYDGICLFLALELAQRCEGHLRWLGVVWVAEILGLCLLPLLPDAASLLSAPSAVDVLTRMADWLILALKLLLLLFFRRIYVALPQSAPGPEQ